MSEIKLGALHFINYIFSQKQNTSKHSSEKWPRTILAALVSHFALTHIDVTLKFPLLDEDY